MSQTPYRYLLHVYGSVSPELLGPFEDESQRDAAVQSEVSGIDPAESFMVGLDVIDGKIEIAVEYDLEFLKYGESDWNLCVTDDETEVA